MPKRHKHGSLARRRLGFCFPRQILLYFVEFWNKILLKQESSERNETMSTSVSEIKI